MVPEISVSQYTVPCCRVVVTLSDASLDFFLRICLSSNLLLSLIDNGTDDVYTLCQCGICCGHVCLSVFLSQIWEFYQNG